MLKIEKLCIFAERKDIEKMEDIRIEDLKMDGTNANKGTDEGRELLGKSLEELGLGRSILVDKDNNVIAGNKTLEAALKLGIKDIVIVETQGDKMVAVKRTDIDLNTEKGRDLAIADNAIGEKNLEWDEEALETLEQEFGISRGEWGDPERKNEDKVVEDPSVEEKQEEEQEQEEKGRMTICPKCYAEFKVEEEVE